jgi:hypothetical protein
MKGKIAIIKHYEILTDETGEYPKGNCYIKKWKEDYKKLRVELWPEKYGGKE